MLSFLYNNVVLFLLVITLLVYVHEFGHYWIARRCGVKVDVFSIGFGPELFGWTGKKSGTRWRFSLLPLGGYVRFAGDANAASMPADIGAMDPAERASSLQAKPVWQRFAVACGGPFANLLFAILVLAVMYVAVGKPYTPPQLGVIEPDGPAAQAGLRSSDTVVEIDGHSVESFEDILQGAQLFPGVPMDMKVERDGKVKQLTVTPKALDFIDRFGNVHRIGDLGVSGVNALARVGTVVPGSPAENAGFKAQDLIVAVDGKAVVSFVEFATAVRAKPLLNVAVTVERDGQRIDLTVVPNEVEATGSDGAKIRIGQIGVASASSSQFRELGPIDAAIKAVGQTWYMTQAIYKVIKQIVLGLRPANEIGGPLRIAKTVGEVSQLGWQAMVSLIIGLSITLGVFNLLPIPMLDGGHLLFYAIEAIRGRPLSPRTQEYGFRIGLILVLSLMVFATFNDLALLKVIDLLTGPGR